MEGDLELVGDVVVVGGRVLADVLRELYLAELEFRDDQELSLGLARVEVTAA